MLNETTLKHWYLVTFFDAPVVNNRILWGIVEEDPSMRGLPGDYCCSSPILKQTADDVFITKNTRYITVGPGQTIAIPVKALIELRAGHAPDDYLALQELLRQGYKRGPDIYE